MKDLYKALLIGLASRIVVFVAAILSSVLLGFVTTHWLPDGANALPFVGLFNRWDSQYYLHTAAYGYPLTPVDPNHIVTDTGTRLIATNWAFFPLYSVFTGALGRLFLPALPLMNSVMLAGFIVSNIAFFVGVYFFYKLSSKIFDSKIALIATAFFSFFVGASFYSAIYSEALFMALALGAFYYLEENKLAPAALLGFLAAFTRSNGFLIFIPFVIYAVQTRKDKLRTVRAALAVEVVALPYLAWNLFGFFTAGVFPIDQIARSTNWPTPLSITDQLTLACPNLGYQIFYIAGLALMFLPAAYLLLSRLWSKSFKEVWVRETKTLKYWVFYPFTIYIVLFQSNIYSTIRYSVVILPIYWVSALIYTKNRAAGIALFGVMATMLVIGAILFQTSGYYM